MKLFYDGNGIEITECKSFFSRFKGFMFKENIKDALLFNRCNSIHTFFMKENIDVIMCDQDNVIKYYFKDFGRNKIILPKKNACKTIELPTNVFNFKINTKIRME